MRLNSAMHFKFEMEENMSKVLLNMKPERNKCKRGNNGEREGGERERERDEYWNGES